MNAALEKALYHLTNNGKLTDVGTDELLQLVNEHPYFAPAQLLLAAKLQQEKSYQSGAQLQKTALYFNNTDWFRYQMMNGHSKDLIITESTPPLPVAQQVTETVAAPPQPPAPVQPVIQEAPVPVVVPPVPEAHKEYLPEVVIPEAVKNIYDIAIPSIENVKEIMSGIDNREEKKPVQQWAEPGFQPSPLQPAQPEPPSSYPPLPSYSQAFQNNKAPEPVESKESAEGFEGMTSIEDLNVNKINTVLSSQLADFKKPVEKDAKLDFESEPYYTIDYFASQGIKADLTQQPQDKLTKQLLKFTDWLKQMKSTNQNQNPQDLGTDPELEKAIQGIAQTSNEAREIVTETMAEVFMKQGKVDKAVQLYIKLSFLDPEKSSYFAAKIQQLKGM